MDFTLTQKEFRERLRETPQHVVDLMGSEETENIIKKVSEAYHIPPIKTRRLAFYVAHVFLGMLEPKEFRETIEKDLEFSAEDATHIAGEIEHNLFDKARKELNNMYGISTFKAGAHKQSAKAPERQPSKIGPIPPPLDLRKIQQEREAATLAQEPDFPGEIVHHGEEEMKAFDNFSPPSREEKKEEGKELPKPEPSKRYTPPEKDTYLEPVEEDKPKQIEEGRTINLSKGQ